jgi:hypothetical protein
VTALEWPLDEVNDATRQPGGVIQGDPLLDPLALGDPAGERPRGQPAGPERDRTAPADERLEDQTDARANLEGVVGGGAECGENGEGSARTQGHCVIQVASSSRGG